MSSRLFCLYISEVCQWRVSSIVYLYHFYFIFTRNAHLSLYANSVDPDETPHVAASDLGLHCLPIFL